MAKEHPWCRQEIISRKLSPFILRSPGGPYGSDQLLDGMNLWDGCSYLDPDKPGRQPLSRHMREQMAKMIAEGYWPGIIAIRRYRGKGRYNRGRRWPQHDIKHTIQPDSEDIFISDIPAIMRGQPLPIPYVDDDNRMMTPDMTDPSDFMDQPEDIHDYDPE